MLHRASVFTATTAGVQGRAGRLRRAGSGRTAAGCGVATEQRALGHRMLHEMLHAEAQLANNVAVASV